MFSYLLYFSYVCIFALWRYSYFSHHPFREPEEKRHPFTLPSFWTSFLKKSCECSSDWVQLPVPSLSAGGLSRAAGMDTLSETDSTPAPTAARDGNVWKRHLWVSAEPIFIKQSFRLVTQNWQTSCMLKWEGRALILWNYEKWTQNGEIECRKSCAG